MPLKIKPVSGHLYFDEVNADNMYQLNSLIEDTEKDKITLITCVENEPEYRRCVQATKE